MSSFSELDGSHDPLLRDLARHPNLLFYGAALLWGVSLLIAIIIVFNRQSIEVGIAAVQAGVQFIFDDLKVLLIPLASFFFTSLATVHFITVMT
jgi:hypothetical protein